jgi:O-antigen/teichoic acid export membrane protein
MQLADSATHTVTARRALLAQRLTTTVSSSFWGMLGGMVTGTMFARAIGFVFPVLLAHWESKPVFALTYFFIGVGFFVAEISTATFPVAMITLAARERRAGDVGCWFAAAAAGSVPAILAAAICGECLSYLVGAPAGLMSIVVIGLSIDGFYFSALTALEEYRLTIVYRALANAVQLAFLAGAVIAGIASVGVVLAIYAFVYLVPIFAIEVYRGPVRAACHWCKRPSGRRIRRLTGFALPSLAAGLSYGAIFGGDVFVVRLLARHDSAIYSAARALAVPLIIAPTAIGTVVQPRTAGATREEQWRMLRRVVGAGIGIALIGILAYAVLAGLLVSAFYGRTYDAAVSELRLIAVALAVLGVHTLLQYWCLGAGLPRLPAISLGCGASITAALAFLLVPPLGGSGAAIAIAAGMTAAACILLALIRRELLSTARDVESQ